MFQNNIVYDFRKINWSVVEEILKCSVYLFGNTIRTPATNDDMSFKLHNKCIYIYFANNI